MTNAHSARPITDVLARAAARLHHDPTESSASRARAVLAAVLNTSVATIAMRAQLHDTVRDDDVVRVQCAIDRLNAGMPFAYAVGTAAFRHLVLHVDERVLIPRPETELLVDHALRLTAGTPGGIAVDIGTGSGAIALSLAQEGAFDHVIATDISSDAITVAHDNAARAAPLRTPIEFRLGADLAPIAGETVQLLISNPPYIAFSEGPELPASVRDWEPPTALFAAEQGMARYRALLFGAPHVLAPHGWLVLECDSRRAEQTADLAHSVGRYDNIVIHNDLTGRPRILVARRTREHH